MNEASIQLVKESFAKVLPIKEQAAQIFYDRLFETNPETKPMFSGDMKEQGKKLMSALAMVVASLDRLEAILPAVKEMAKRHVSYGVTTDQYAAVGAALLWTLGAGLGEEFTPDVESAWSEAYTILADTMIQATLV